MIFEAIYILMVFQFLTIPMMAEVKSNECSNNSMIVYKRGHHFCWSLKQAGNSVEPVCKGNNNGAMVTIYGDEEIALASELFRKHHIAANKSFHICLHRRINEMKSTWTPINYGRVPKFLEIVNNLGNVAFEKAIGVGDRLIISFIPDFTGKNKIAEIILQGSYESSQTLFKISLEQNSTYVMVDRTELRYNTWNDSLYDMTIVLDFKRKTEMLINVNDVQEFPKILNYAANFNKITVSNMYVTNLDHRKMNKNRDGNSRPSRPSRHIEMILKKIKNKESQEIENPAMTSVLVSSLVDVHNAQRTGVFDKLPLFFNEVFEPKSDLEVSYEFRLGGNMAELTNLTFSFYEKLEEPAKWSVVFEKIKFERKLLSFEMSVSGDSTQTLVVTQTAFNIDLEALIGAIKFTYMDDETKKKGTICLVSFFGGLVPNGSDAFLLYFRPPSYVVNFVRIESNLAILSTFIRSSKDVKVVSTCGFVPERDDAQLPKIPYNEVVYEEKIIFLCEEPLLKNVTVDAKIKKTIFEKRGNFHYHLGFRKIWYIISSVLVLINVVLILCN